MVSILSAAWNGRAVVLKGLFHRSEKDGCFAGKRRFGANLSFCRFFKLFVMAVESRGPLGTLPGDCGFMTIYMLALKFAAIFPPRRVVAGATHDGIEKTTLQEKRWALDFVCENLRHKHVFQCMF